MSGKSWDETETPFAKEVILFVNKETCGEVAWFKQKDDGTWETMIQTSAAFCVVVTAKSEEALAVEYWKFYYKRVQASASRYSGFLRRYIFNREKYAESQERLKRWNAWRNERSAYFTGG